jgi:hypothetical protein
MTLSENIIHSSFKFVPIVNKIEKHFITPHLAFTQIFQLKGYWQYGIDGSIVNVPTNSDLVQTILLILLYDDSSIVVFLKRKLLYKYMYMSSYVHPNIVIKVLQELCQTPIY